MAVVGNGELESNVHYASPGDDYTSLEARDNSVENLQDWVGKMGDENRVELWAYSENLLVAVVKDST